MDANLLLLHIKKFESFVEKGNKLLTKVYQLDEPPLLSKRHGKLPKSGKVPGYEMFYNFHGMGCYFKFGRYEVDFDYTFGDFVYVGFQVSKLSNFIQSSLGETDVFDQNAINRALIILEENGQVIRNITDYKNTYEYRLVKE